MAYTLTLTLSAGGLYMGLTGHEWLAGALFTTTIGAVATAFVMGRRDRNRAEPK
jgi:hypothetical protein